MSGKPLLIFVQACRGRFNEVLADDYVQADSPEEPKYHTIRDTFFFFSSPPGNRAFRPRDHRPSFFLEILANKMNQFGPVEDMEEIARRVIETMTNSDPVDYRVGDRIKSTDRKPC